MFDGRSAHFRRNSDPGDSPPETASGLSRGRRNPLVISDLQFHAHFLCSDIDQTAKSIWNRKRQTMINHFLATNDISGLDVLVSLFWVHVVSTEMCPLPHNLTN
jgi:hypothetical protein